MLYNIFSEFLEDISEDVLPNDLHRLSGQPHLEEALQLPAGRRHRHHQQAGDLQRLHPCRQRRPREDLHRAGRHQVLRAAQPLRARALPEEARRQLDELQQATSPPTIFAKDRFNYDVLCHTDLLRDRGESFGMPLNRINWGNYDLVVIDESHNFRNNDAFKDRETRYQRLMNQSSGRA